MKICFLLTHVPNPRINKRIELLKKTADVSVICVRRTRLNIFEPIQDVRHVIFEFDFPESKYLLKRYIASAEFRRKALEKLYEISPNVIYAEGLDCLITAGQYKQKRRAHVVLEIADLREDYISQPKNPAKRGCFVTIRRLKSGIRQMPSMRFRFSEIKASFSVSDIIPTKKSGALYRLTDYPPVSISE